MKKDVGIILIVLLAIILGGLAGALTGRAGRDYSSEADGVSPGALDGINGRLADIERRLAALESGPVAFSNEGEIEARLRSVGERLSKLENETAAPPRIGAAGKPAFQPKATVSPDPAVARPAPLVNVTATEKRREIIEKQYDYRKKYVDRQMKVLQDASRSNMPLSEAQIISLTEIMYDTLRRKKEFDLLVLDDPARANERSEEFKRLEESEDDSARGLLDEGQYKLFQRYTGRSGSSGARGRGKRW